MLDWKRESNSGAADWRLTESDRPLIGDLIKEDKGSDKPQSLKGALCAD